MTQNPEPENPQIRYQRTRVYEEHTQQFLNFS